LAPTGVGITAVNRQTFDDWLLNEGLLTAADHPTYGSYWRLPPKVSFSGSKPRLAPACAAGEHSRAILAELGYDDDAIARLVAAGVTSDGGT